MDRDPDGHPIPGVDGRYRTLRTVQRGGIYDCLARTFTEPSAAPMVWYCSESQLPLILHEHPEPWVVMEGAEGGGKSRVLAMWAVNQALFELQGCAMGVTAPTYPRIDIIAAMIREYLPAGSFTWRAEEHDFVTVTGVTINCRSTTQKTKQGGSPIQGYTWRRHGGDEIQDYDPKIEGDILARGRGAEAGQYRRFNTCSAKESPSWRTWKANRKALPAWRFVRVTGPENIFVAPEHWSNMKASGISLREWERRALGKDGQPEKAVYHNFDRSLHLKPVPHIGAVDVTARVLRRFTGDLFHTVLVGHDPGKRRHVSELLKCYEVRQPGADPLLCWWVVGEVETPATTTTEHGIALCRYAQDTLGIPLPYRIGGDGRPEPLRDAQQERLYTHADPYAARLQVEETADERHPHRTVYTQLRNLGLTVRAANYAMGKPCAVPKEAGIGMVISLLVDAQKRTRFYIGCDRYGTPVAPKLVEALETQETDATGRAEWERKTEDDTSHYSSSIRFALWMLEQVRLVAGGSHGTTGTPEYR